MSFRRIFAMAFKESLQALRDPSTALIAVILPMILLFLMGYAVSLDAKNIKFGIVNHSSSTNSKELVSSFVGAGFFDIKFSQTTAKFQKDMQNYELGGFLVIDENLGKFAFEIITDGSDPNTANLINQYATQIIKSWSKETFGVRNLDIQTRFWFNEKLSSRYFAIPGSIAVIMTLIGTLLTSLVVAREWEQGTMECLMSTPISNLEIILGKLIPYFALGMFSVLLCFIIAYFWYEVPFRGSLWVLLALSFIYMLPALCTGLLISTLAKSQFVAAQISILVGFLPAFLLSGYIFEISNMPEILQFMTYAIPARYFVSSLSNIFLVGDTYEIFIKDAICMLGIGFLLLGLVLKISKRSLD
ncbi:ABC transporter, permease protein [Campylobacter iguaniorum]|uniref:ABC transporter, permease protein n=1 Tax=Campylobacter iguaniorum TaxID=1244531 RepID=A0A076FE76_9BACT|nr:ABC transporter permease [Campylobacter iguaniorum]AII14144.1 ABC transporter, permease protein [Campylobacter iguaniorum]ALV23883.1 ABC transporter, permease protein [Campylobacter iguaniorum]